MKLESSLHRSQQNNSIIRESLAHEPELTTNQKISYISLVRVTSIIGVFLSLPLIIMPFFFGTELNPTHQILLIIFGASNMILSFLALAWTRSRFLFKNNSYSVFGLNTLDDVSVFYNPLGDSLFGLGSFQIVINILMLFSSFANYDVNLSRYTAP